jgi:hypothetical protein
VEKKGGARSIDLVEKKGFRLRSRLFFFDIRAHTEKAPQKRPALNNNNRPGKKHNKKKKRTRA